MMKETEVRENPNSKRLLVDPDLWGSDVTELIDILNEVYIPEEYIKKIQDIIDEIAIRWSNKTELSYGDDI